MTRREQFDARQRKFAKRNRKMNRHNAGLKIPNEAIFKHGGGKTWYRVERGPMQPLQVKGRRISRMEPEGGPPSIGFNITEAGFARPPHCQTTGPVADFFRAKNWHFQFSIVGFHRRITLKRGRKTPRMNGAQRREMGALWHALTEGYWPDWDPQGRHPTAADIDNGDPFITIPDWRWGITGDYP